MAAKQERENSKLQQKFIEPYQVMEAYRNHTDLIERQRQNLVQNKVQLKRYHPCMAEPGKTPASLELEGAPI